MGGNAVTESGRTEDASNAEVFEVEARVGMPNFCLVVWRLRVPDWHPHAAGLQDKWATCLILHSFWPHERTDITLARILAPGFEMRC